MNFPANLRYTKDHEWISLDGDVATIGITDFAQKELGDIVYVEIETAGKTLDAEAVFGSVEAVNRFGPFPAGYGHHHRSEQRSRRHSGTCQYRPLR